MGKMLKEAVVACFKVNAKFLEATDPVRAGVDLRNTKQKNHVTTPFGG
jgi:hypothetical protein